MPTLSREAKPNAGFDNGLYQILCKVCSSPIVRPPSQLAKSQRLFCSQKCYQSIRQGKYVPWRQGQRRARAVVARHFDLKPEHIVHHEDRDNRNNSLLNLMVFANQSEHMAYHHGISGVKPLWDGREHKELVI
jgi:hypothetical protein